MEKENGRFETMDSKLHHVTLRHKSKVPRTRLPQRFEYVDSSGKDYRNGAVKKEHNTREYETHGMSPPLLHQLADTDENKEWLNLIGQRVCISGVKPGILRYYGKTNFAEGLWCGIELDEPVGKNNGTVNGYIYFACKQNHGIFAPVGKVSKLNDLSACSWPIDTTLPKVQDSHQRHQSWDYNVGYLQTHQGVKVIKNSNSDPTSLKPKAMSNMPHTSHSFSYDSRNVIEKRRSESLVIKALRNYETSELSSRRGKSFSDSSAFINNSPSSHSLHNYDSAKNAMFYSSNSMRLNDRESLEPIQDTHLSSSSCSRNFTKVNKPLPSLPMGMGQFEQYLQTPTNSGQRSPSTSELNRTKERSYFEGHKLPDPYINTYSSYDYPDMEDEIDNDEQMSVEYDESLGILTPSQMKDFTLCPDFPTSSSDLKGFDFPSSESFDDINELPEDEQVHDVSVQYVPESTSCKNVEITKQNNISKYSTNYSLSSDNRTEKILSSTGKFLSSISQNKFEKINVGSYPVHSKVNTDLHKYNRSHKINNILAAKNYFPNPNSNFGNEINDKEFLFNSLPNSGTVDMPKNMEIVKNFPTNASTFHHSVSGEQENEQSHPNLVNCHSLMHEEKITNKILSYTNDVLTTKNYDTDNSRDSVMHGESENIITKEKLTVSWEDCIQNSNCSLTSTERPESVYTVGSSDTGYQDDAEIELETGMVTSMDSTDSTKRFSTASRDSCIVVDEVDVYKIAESNSTSGYSTGLSDSCCNDRPEDDLSSKPLTEELQDSVGPCDSEDGFSFQEHSLSKDSEMVAEMSDVTAETVTAICNDSTSEALCETMVEDTTLTDINDLLASPEEAKSSNLSDQTENCDTSMEQSKNLEGETESKKVSEKDQSSIPTGSPAQSTPENKLNKNRSKVDTQKKPPINSNKGARQSRTCDENADKKKLVPKSPKKNVMSKIKAMIEATSCKTSVKTKPEVTENVTKRVATVPKRSRWEAVTSKIAASLAEEKTKPKTKREIRSRVDTNLTSARQQITACKSPMLDSSRNSNCGDGTLTPVSLSSRERKPMTERNSAINLGKEVRAAIAREAKQDIKSQRPGRSSASSRPTSPVAASESSTTSVSINSHNSRSKIAHWKGSSSTIASSIPPPAPPVVLKRSTPTTTPKPTAQLSRTVNTRTVNKKPLSVPKIRITSATTPSSVRMRSPSPVASSKPERCVKQSRTSKEQTGVRGLTSKPVRPPMWLSKAELTQEIQRLGTLCEARTKELNRLKMETKHVSIGFDAFAALFKYMVDDLNALSVPVLTNDLEKTLKQLELAKQDLAYYEREVEEMKAHHSQELNDLSNKLFEVYQGELTELSAKHQEELNQLNYEHQQQIENLTEKLQTSSDEMQSKQGQLISEMQQELIMQREELQSYHEREIKDLEEKHAQATKILQEHTEQLQKKCVELNQHSMSMEDAMQKDTDSKLQWVTSRKIDLEKEVESLKAVLEMKNKELHSLRIQTLEMEKQLEELPFAREKIKMLHARAEDLEALMVEKTNLERKLSTENQTVKDSYEKESKINKRLSMENEELHWRLRQAENTLLSGSFAEVSDCPDDEIRTSSPIKTPPAPQMSRSVFFTFVDKDDNSSQSPRSQYKKIMPGFASTYRASPGRTQKSSSAPSPRRSKSHSEPPQPPTILCTPRKVAKQKNTSKRPRSGSDSGRQANEHTEVTFSSVTGSMASSVSSESSVFEHKEQLLEEHEEQIMETLQILQEQRSVESPTDEPLTPNFASLDKEWCNGDSKESSVSPDFETEDMSRSSEFSDPKTYYHMTFPVPKEAGIADCDKEELDKNSSEGTTPSIEEPAKSIHSRKSGDNQERWANLSEGQDNTLQGCINNGLGSTENSEPIIEPVTPDNNSQSTDSNQFDETNQELRTI